MNVLLVYAASRMDTDESIRDDATVVPMSLMALAAFLERHHYPVRILDARIYPRAVFAERFRKEVAWADSLGFSVMTSQVRHARFLSQWAKELKLGIPVIWGGIHPTLFPLQTCQDDFVDYVIAGEGEPGLVKLLEQLAKNRFDGQGIDGLAFSDGSRLIVNPVTPPIDAESLPRLAYHLVDLEQYMLRTLPNGRRVRGMDVLTSRGCPYRCASCVNPFGSYRKWRAISAKRALEDIRYLVEQHRIEHIRFADYFFGKKERADEIIRGLPEQPKPLSWEANIQVDDFNECGMNDEWLVRIQQSGCIRLSMSMESASERMLKLMEKGITPEQIVFAVNQCKQHGIVSRGAWITALPHETPDDLKRTLALIWDLHRTPPCDDDYTPAFYHPYPGGKHYAECRKQGFREPESLKAWAETEIKHGPLDLRERPWLPDENMFRTLNAYGRCMAAADRFRRHVNPVFAWIGRIGRAWLEFRMRRDFWKFRFELWWVNNRASRT